ncbi:hypothetical protein U1701_18275 [Sphingomonas sp. PB2P19]|uniref:hypothetical protein n=1 Tax=Sphingomonas rhamnosi TaxID=3096156 RepID=UPI002FC9BE26
MLFNVAIIAGGMVKAFLSSLKQDSAKVKALAENEARKLAASIEIIGQLLLAGEIDQPEAEALIDVQKNATETVFASLEGVGRAAARHATRAGLTSIVGAVDSAIGMPLVGAVIGLVAAPPSQPASTALNQLDGSEQAPMTPA